MKTKILFFLLIFTASFTANAQEGLYNLSLEELLTLEVEVASKSQESLIEAPGIISVLTNKEIEVYGALNLGDLLNRITSIQFIQGGMLPYNVASIRGQHNGVFDNHVLILLNGRPFRDGSSGGVNSPIYNSFPIGIIDHIEIIRGPGSALYGSNAFSGVINIITKHNDNNGLIIKNCLTAGSFSTFQENICGIYKKNDFKFNFAINAFLDNGENFEFYDASGVLSNGNYEKDGNGIFINSSYKNFSLNFAYTDFKPYYIGNQILWENAGEIESLHRTFANLAYKDTINSWLSLDANLTYNGFNWEPDNSNSNTANFELAFTVKPTEKISIIAASVSNYNEWGGNDFIANSHFCSNIYSQLTYQLANWAKLIGGFQLNNLGEEKQHFSPRLGLISHFSENFGLKILYSNAYRNPYPTETSFDRINVKGNPNLISEKIKTFESQLFFQNKNIQTSINYYQSKMTDLIIKVRNPLQGVASFENLLEQDFWGIEYEGKFNLIEKFSIFSSFTYQENENSNGIENSNYTPNIMAKLGAFYNSDKFTFGIFNSYFGEPTQCNDLLPIDMQIPENNPIPKAFNLLTANISLNINELMHFEAKTNFKLELYITNLLNEEIYFPEISVNAINSIPLYPGRAYFGKLILKLN